MTGNLPQPKKGEVYMVVDRKGMVLWPPRQWAKRSGQMAPWEERGDRLIEPSSDIFLSPGETIHVLEEDPSGIATAIGTTLDGRRVMFTGLDVLMNGLTSLGEMNLEEEDQQRRAVQEDHQDVP